MTGEHNTMRLYDDLAWLWPIWGGPEEYADHCDYMIRLVREHAQIPVRSLLNIGCGGGKNAFNLKKEYEVTGVDLSPRMLALAKELNPDCEFLEGDMRTFSLGRTFDALLMDDGITHMASRPDLTSAFKTAFQHVNPGGVMVVTPDDTTETFVQNRTQYQVVSAPDPCKSKPDNVEVVFIENAYDPDPTDDCFEGTILYLIREDGKLRVEIDRSVDGLFSLDIWRQTLTSVGFEIHEQKHSQGDKEHVHFACVRPE